ncbi:hypothetical protein ACHHYP_10701 [Achlya hypogyna]|uniref:WRKY transcription factor 19 n=1 Tax=Achlya hypogyna TaxID=1202772 RepID=A0A1V9YKR2_ACHHY|nr:hypothetical protein ACHHYP_10701 [Achlya hypogyna]
MAGATKCIAHKNKLKCSVNGCMNQVYARYLCVRHGGKKQCEKPGCVAFVSRGTLCVDHGGVLAKRYCIEPGCDRQAHARYKCVRHGGGRSCRIESCALQARAGGLCHRHRTEQLDETQTSPKDDAWLLDEMVLVDCMDIRLDESQVLNDMIDDSILSALCDSLAKSPESLLAMNFIDFELNL